MSRLLTLVAILLGQDVIGLHHINMLTDEVLSTLRGNFRPFVELEDLEYDSSQGHIICRNGNGTGLAAMARHGYARQHHYFGDFDYVTASLSLDPFSFTYSDCKINVNGTRVAGKQGGTLQDATIFFKMRVDSPTSGPCSAEIVKMTLERAKVRLDESSTTSLMVEHKLIDAVLKKLQASIIECINLTIVEYTDIKPTNLANCDRTSMNRPKEIISLDPNHSL